MKTMKRAVYQGYIAIQEIQYLLCCSPQRTWTCSLYHFISNVIISLVTNNNSIGLFTVLTSVLQAFLPN